MTDEDDESLAELTRKRGHMEHTEVAWYHWLSRLLLLAMIAFAIYILGQRIGVFPT